VFMPPKKPINSPPMRVKVPLWKRIAGPVPLDVAAGLFCSWFVEKGKSDKPKQIPVTVVDVGCKLWVNDPAWERKTY